MKAKFVLVALLTVLMAATVAVAGDQYAPPPAAAAVEVGNKICPVSGHAVGEMGKAVKFEHEGKIYNLCCAMCKGDFEKDPAKYIEKVNQELSGK